MGQALPQLVEKYEKYEEKVIKRWPGTSKMFNDYQASFVCVVFVLLNWVLWNYKKGKDGDRLRKLCAGHSRNKD